MARARTFSLIFLIRRDLSFEKMNNSISFHTYHLSLFLSLTLTRVRCVLHIPFIPFRAGEHAEENVSHAHTLCRGESIFFPCYLEMIYDYTLGIVCGHRDYDRGGDTALHHQTCAHVHRRPMPFFFLFQRYWVRDRHLNIRVEPVCLWRVRVYSSLSPCVVVILSCSNHDRTALTPHL